MLRSIPLIFLLAFLTGCAAAGVPYTSDPAKKISYAYWLFDDKLRPLPAEKLIIDSIEIYKERNDNAGLAVARTAYAIFLRSYAVEKYQGRYIKQGFIDKSITYDTRHEKSIEYLELSKDYYQSQEKYGDLTNAYLHMGFTYAVAGENTKACNVLKESISANKIFTEENPEISINLGGFETYKDYIVDVINRGKIPNCVI